VTEKRKRGRPATREQTIAQRSMDAIISSAKAQHGEPTAEERKLLDILSGHDGRSIEKELIRSHSPNMPHNLIMAAESAGPEFMTHDEIEAAHAAYEKHRIWVSEMRRDGQQQNKADATVSASKLLAHPALLPILQQLKPLGDLSVAYAATLAKVQLDGALPKKEVPSQRTLRRILTAYKKSILATQRP